MKRISILVFFLAFLISASYAQKVALKTNALMIAALTPNLECEFVTGEKTSIGLSAFGHYKPYGIDSKMVGIQPEFRWWFNGRPMVREYLGIALLGTSYDMHIKDNIYNGDAIGAGITMGYSLPLARHWNIEFYGGFGAVGFWQKRYFENDSYDDSFVDNNIKTNSRGYKLLPIKLGVSISYIIK